MVPPELGALVEANAWTYGPVATALRVLRLTIRAGQDPAALWEPLLEQCPRMAPLGYWLLAARSGGLALAGIEEDLRRRRDILASNLDDRIGPARTVLLVGHDVEIDALRSRPGRLFRYLLLDGAPGVEPPGGFSRRRFRSESVGEPFAFAALEDALDWADAVVLAGFVVHRQNLLGPAQLRPVLASARDQVDCVLLCALNERRLTLGEGSPRRYCDDFRPYLWQSGVTHLVSEWHSGAEGTTLGWLPLPPDVLKARFGEELFPS